MQARLQDRPITLSTNMSRGGALGGLSPPMDRLVISSLLIDRLPSRASSLQIILSDAA